MGETGCDIWGKGGVSANFKKNLDRASQAVAIFGTRRVTLGATVLAMELALGGSRAMYTRAAHSDVEAEVTKSTASIGHAFFACEQADAQHALTHGGSLGPSAAMPLEKN